MPFFNMKWPEFEHKSRESQVTDILRVFSSKMIEIPLHILSIYSIGGVENNEDAI